MPLFQRNRNFTGSDQYIIQEFHFNEVIGCSGTGLGLCQFEFAAADGHKLIVITANNAKRYGGPTLYRWSIEKN